MRREAGAAAPQALPRRSYCGVRGDPEDARFALLAKDVGMRFPGLENASPVCSGEVARRSSCDGC